MRKALVIGLDYYGDVENNLYGCVSDAYNVKTALDRHSDGTKNFDVQILTSSNENQIINNGYLSEMITELFKHESDIALFYFSGHGYINDDTGGALVSSDRNLIPLDKLLQCANESKAKNKIIILDCCHAGYVGKTDKSDYSLLCSGVTILAASDENQYAMEKNGSGVFTNLFVDALNGGAANLLGQITPGSVYAYIDQSLGAWDQRPIFKTNVKQFTPIRYTQPAICLEDLKKITEIFSEPGVALQLDPTFEEDRSFDPNKELPLPNEENVEVFKVLQKLVKVNLVVPIDADHMFYAAIESKSCKLTVLGEHYWKLITNDRV